MTDADLTLPEVQNRSQQWLLDQRPKSGGGWAERPGMSANSMNTAECMLALLEARLPGNDSRILDATKFLIDHQSRSGAHSGSWPRDVPDGGAVEHLPDVIRTALAVRALIKKGEDPREIPVKTAIEWLKKIRSKDKFWGFAPDLPSNAIATCFVCLAILEEIGTDPGQINKAFMTETLTALAATKNSDRSFGSADLQAVTTMYAGLVMQAARSRQLHVTQDVENNCIQWLRDHPDPALRRVEQPIVLVGDASDRVRNYEFVHMTESLLLKLFVGADKPSLLDSPLARSAFRRLKDSLRDDGAFYGPRVTSWATAHALSALAVASSAIKMFPDRPSEAKQIKLKGLVIGSAIVVVALSSFFQWKAMFGTGYAITLNVVFLVMLLVSDLIHEDSFVRLSVAGIRALGPGTKNAGDS